MLSFVRHYLMLPRVIDSFSSNPDGHHARRQFRKRLEAEDKNLGNAWLSNDLRMGKIAGVLGSIEYIALTTDNEEFLNEQMKIYGQLIDERDENKREKYSSLPNEEKFKIADSLRALARTVYFTDVEDA